MGLSRPVRLSATALASAGLVTTGIGFPTSQLAHAEGRTVMATTAVNVRSGPGTSYKILGVLYPGHTAQQIGNTKYGWAQVTWKGHTAYVAARYLRGSSAADSSSTHVTLRPSPGVPKAAPVSASVVRPVVGQKRSTAVLMVRSSYTNHFGSEGDAPIGTIFDVTGRTANGLAEVIWQGRPRWVNAKYLTSVNAHRPARHNAPIKPGRATRPSTPGKSTKPSKQAKPRTPARPAKPSTPAKPVVRPVVGQARGTTALMIRTSFTSHFGTEGDAPSGTIFDVTGRKANGMAEVIWQGRPRWVNAKYLTPVGSPKPKPSKPRTPAKPARPTTPAKPKPSTPATPKVIGVRYATTALDIRTASGSSSRTVGEVTTGTALSITGVTANGRSQIVYRGQTRWVTSKWLSANKPGTTKPAASKKTKSGKTSTPSSPGNWNKLMAGGSEGLSGLRPSAKGLVNNVLQNFPQINTIYGVRPHDPYPDHPSGHAIDLMLPNYKSNEALGWKMAKYYQAHASELGVSYIIFHQQIWSVARDSEGWRHMEDRGGDTANHMDHVHITTIWD
ncbi:MAG: SH3 domain-containing protein [Cutibacterium granulosum]|uniref:SH3 domain-containing protein n=2 Tax=Cutibacterium granulosum TaxID=33011 RepID=UPI002B231C36|nr:SH3 domain-containing protein [Cutibacterium granulosum]MEA5648411.1 SH3 domain-containing protein [Cutibacterium granulosum]MEA5654724.1 SH3 domain-containing protein [Cutibacterium granulosum]MEA5662847.1 SH3 domain-containing protein [Cutibacterium granulosum]